MSKKRPLPLGRRNPVNDGVINRIGRKTGKPKTGKKETPKDSKGFPRALASKHGLLSAQSCRDHLGKK